MRRRRRARSSDLGQWRCRRALSRLGQLVSPRLALAGDRRAPDEAGRELCLFVERSRVVLLRLAPVSWDLLADLAVGRKRDAQLSPPLQGEQSANEGHSEPDA